MVFTTTTLFKGIQCPELGRCTLTNCIFAHDPKTPKDVTTVATPTNGTRSAPHTSRDTSSEPALKRRKITYAKPEDKPPTKADVIRQQLEQERSKSSITTLPPKSLARTVSPPPARSSPAAVRPSTPKPATNPSAKVNKAIENSESTPKTRVSSSTTALSPPVTLNPRLIPNDPAGHAKRSLTLKLLHTEMTRLNEQLLGEFDGKARPIVVFDDMEMVRLALDEEEKLARTQGSVYMNVIKNRIAAYRKMKLEDWTKYVKTTDIYAVKAAAAEANGNGSATQNADAPPNTSLSPQEEVAMLPRMVVVDQKPLIKHGYIPIPPTAEQIATAIESVKASANYEVCERCGARFQLFTDRNPDGSLTSNGPCRYHPLRKIQPSRSSKADTGPREAFYPCCNEVLGSAGCARHADHVFKTSSAARLAAVLPFITTPENPTPAVDSHGHPVPAVAFDCEMGYTTLGMELVRLTAVSWPHGETLVDVLVRPLGIIIDLNSRFSGVWPEHIATAPPHQPSSSPTTNSATSPLAIVPSPTHARALLCTFLTPSTPLIGHAIENDLNATRLCHPTIIDTILLFPHPRGLPMRYGLRMLASKYLNRRIQVGDGKGEVVQEKISGNGVGDDGRGGAGGVDAKAQVHAGHDSAEDARATGDLVRVRAEEVWKGLRRAGWKMSAAAQSADGGREEAGKMMLVPPEGTNAPASGSAADRGATANL